jgi:hypothetical protein
MSDREVAALSQVSVRRSDIFDRLEWPVWVVNDFTIMPVGQTKNPVPWFSVCKLLNSLLAFPADNNIDVGAS